MKQICIHCHQDGADLLWRGVLEGFYTGHVSPTIYQCSFSKSGKHEFSEIEETGALEIKMDRPPIEVVGK